MGIDNLRAVLAYVPVVSRAHLDFFWEQKSYLPVFVLGSDFLKEFPILERDHHAITPEQAVAMLRPMGVKAMVLDRSILRNLIEDNSHFVLPVDEIMSEFAAKYLANSLTESINVWLRWNRTMATAQQEVSANRVITSDQFDQEVMKLAEKKASKSSDWWRQVGAVLVKDGQPILTAYNHHLPNDFAPYINGDPRSNFSWGGDHIELCSALHAEIGVISGAAARGIATKGSSIYVTTFPCPPCARAIGAAGIKKVFYRDGYSMMDAEEILGGYETEIILVC
ncbi:MAG: deaminase [Candidatus Paceibacterota bacterium]|jgi:dCMP deaminase